MTSEELACSLVGGGGHRHLVTRDGSPFVPWWPGRSESNLFRVIETTITHPFSQILETLP